MTWKPGERHRGVVIETAVSLDGAAVRVQYADEVVWMRDDEGWRVERVPTDAASLSAAAVERANALARDRPVHWVGIVLSTGKVFGSAAIPGKCVSVTRSRYPWRSASNSRGANTASSSASSSAARRCRTACSSSASIPKRSRCDALTSRKRSKKAPGCGRRRICKKSIN